MSPSRQELEAGIANLVRRRLGILEELRTRCQLLGRRLMDEDQRTAWRLRVRALRVEYRAVDDWLGKVAQEHARVTGLAEKDPT